MNADEKQAFKDALTTARTSFDRSRKRLADIESEAYWLREEMGKLRRTITALAEMCREAPWTDAMGITDACTEVMTAEKGTVSTQDVLRSLEAIGFDLSSQKNAGASVHSILGRLAEKGKIEKIDATDAEGGAVVKWRGPSYDEEYDLIPF